MKLATFISTCLILQRQLQNVCIAVLLDAPRVSFAVWGIYERTCAMTQAQRPKNENPKNNIKEPLKGTIIPAADDDVDTGTDEFGAKGDCVSGLSA